MDSVWMKNLSVPFTYSSRRKIFLQGCPPEMWHSHARWPAATLPTRFSIKQANNTIPTPINKWSFLNKVLYTEPLAEATHHTLMEPCTSQSYFSPSFYIYEQSGTKSAEEAQTTGAEAHSDHRHTITWLNTGYDTALSVSWFMRLSTCAVLAPSPPLPPKTVLTPSPPRQRTQTLAFRLISSLSGDRLFTAVWTFRVLARQMLGRLSTRCYC